tara:strand:- start:73 stop:1818 length:1746 start_codon:yes stop_codon:yes gene_type:complete
MVQDLIRIDAEQRVKEKALEALVARTDISASRKAKIRTIITESGFSGIYSEYLLSQDPLQFRAELPHNQQYRQVAQNLGLQVEGPEIEDDGVTIALSSTSLSPLTVHGVYAHARDLFKGLDLVVESIQDLKTSIIPEFRLDVPMRVDYENPLSNIGGRNDDAEKLSQYFSNFIKMETLPSHLADLAKALDEAINGVVASDRYQELLGKHQEWRERVDMDTSLYRDDYGDDDGDDIDDDFDGDDFKEIFDENFFPTTAMQQMYEMIQEGIETAKEHYAEEQVRPLISILENASTLLEPFYELNRTGNWTRDSVEEAIKSLENPQEISGHLVNAEKLTDQFFEGSEKLLESSQSQTATPLDQYRREIDNAFEHLQMLSFEPPQLTSKLKNKGDAKYMVKKEQLLPEDIDFGNDGGACIGIYGDEPGAEDSIPFYQLDEGTYIFGIYQQVGNQRQRRVGFALAFATVDNDDKPVLFVNSIELSDKTNPLDTQGIGSLIGHTLDWIKTYAHQKGFSNVAMGTLEHNIGHVYAPQGMLSRPDKSDRLGKIPNWISKGQEKPTGFFSEVLDYGDLSTGPGGAWKFVK